MHFKESHAPCSYTQTAANISPATLSDPLQGNTGLQTAPHGFVWTWCSTHWVHCWSREPGDVLPPGLGQTATEYLLQTTFHTILVGNRTIGGSSCYLPQKEKQTKTLRKPVASSQLTKRVEEASQTVCPACLTSTATEPIPASAAP